MMQPKVSMVTPCYNKEAYIGNMFDSILAQKWDNIELILVNDGSTDGTREIIAQYEPKLKARGYEVVIIDQHNQGVAAAVKHGLMRITGEYVCMPDCDDELHPEYVRAMAGWLEEHPEDQWAACDMYVVRRGKAPSQISWYKELPLYCKRQNQPPENDRYPRKLLESLLLRRILPSIGILLVRSSYLRQCGLPDSMIIDPPITQEPQVFISLALGGSLPKYIDLPLYYYHYRENSILTSQKSGEYKRKYIGGVFELIEKTLAQKQYEGKYDKRVVHISKIILSHRGFGDMELKGACELVDYARECFGENEKLNANTAKLSGIEPLGRYLGNRIMEYAARSLPITRKGSGRIIACAAFGTAATLVRTGLLNSNIRPDVFWDSAAKEGDEIDSIPVIKPNFKDLGEHDIVLILLYSDIAKVFDKSIRATPARDNVWYYYDVLDYLARYYYGS